MASAGTVTYSTHESRCAEMQAESISCDLQVKLSHSGTRVAKLGTQLDSLSGSGQVEHQLQLQRQIQAEKQLQHQLQHQLQQHQLQHPAPAPITLDQTAVEAVRRADELAQQLVEARTLLARREESRRRLVADFAVQKAQLSSEAGAVMHLMADASAAGAVRVAQLSEELAASQAKLEASSAQMVSMQAEAAAACKAAAAHAAQLSAQLITAQAQMKTAQAQMETAQSQAGVAAAHAAHVSAQLVTVQAQMETAQSQAGMEAAHTAHVSAQLVTVQAQLESLQSQAGMAAAAHAAEVSVLSERLSEHAAQATASHAAWAAREDALVREVAGLKAGMGAAAQEAAAREANLVLFAGKALLRQQREERAASRAALSHHASLSYHAALEAVQVQTDAAGEVAAAREAALLSQLAATRSEADTVSAQLVAARSQASEAAAAHAAQMSALSGQLAAAQSCSPSDGASLSEGSSERASDASALAMSCTDGGVHVIAKPAPPPHAAQISALSGQLAAAQSCSPSGGSCRSEGSAERVSDASALTMSYTDGGVHVIAKPAPSPHAVQVSALSGRPAATQSCSSSGGCSRSEGSAERVSVADASALAMSCTDGGVLVIAKPAPPPAVTKPAAKSLWRRTVRKLTPGCFQLPNAQ